MKRCQSEKLCTLEIQLYIGLPDIYLKAMFCIYVWFEKRKKSCLEGMVHLGSCGYNGLNMKYEQSTAFATVSWFMGMQLKPVWSGLGWFCLSSLQCQCAHTKWGVVSYPDMLKEISFNVNFEHVIPFRQLQLKSIAFWRTENMRDFGHFDFKKQVETSPEEKKNLQEGK